LGSCFPLRNTAVIPGAVSRNTGILACAPSDILSAFSFGGVQLRCAHGLEVSFLLKIKIVLNYLSPMAKETLDKDGLEVGLSSDELQRYSRQINLSQVGKEGQRRLKEARVLCIGAGGLGSPASLYLAAAGIGTLGIVDRTRLILAIFTGSSCMERTTLAARKPIRRAHVCLPSTLRSSSRPTRRDCPPATPSS